MDIIDSREIEKISGYKVAYFPCATMLDKNTEQTLKAFAENGGILLLDEGFGLRQGNTWLTQNHIDFPKLFDVKWHNRIRDYENENVTFALEGERVTVKPYRTDYEVANSTVLAQFDDLAPAISSVSLEKGKIVLFGTSIGYSYATFAENGWKKLMKSILPDCSKMECFGDDIITYLNETPDGELRYLFNTGERDACLSCVYDKVVFGGEKAGEGMLLLKAGDVACVYTKKK